MFLRRFLKQKINECAATYLLLSAKKGSPLSTDTGIEKNLEKKKREREREKKVLPNGELEC